MGKVLKPELGYLSEAEVLDMLFPDKLHHSMDPKHLALRKFRWSLFDGTKCPFCGKHEQIYHYSMTWSSALFLLEHRAKLYEVGSVLFYVNKTLKIPMMQKLKKLEQQSAGSGGEYLKSRYWGLLVPREAPDREEMHRSHALTPEGLAFTHGQVSLRSMAWVYHNATITLDGPPIRFRECFDKKFDFRAVVLGWGRKDDSWFADPDSVLTSTGIELPGMD